MYIYIYIYIYIYVYIDIIMSGEGRVLPQRNVSPSYQTANLQRPMLINNNDIVC